MSTIPFRPAIAAPPLTGDPALEIWNAVMWAYHDGHITPAQGSVAMGIPAEQFARSYAVWHERVIGGPPDGPDVRSAPRP